MSSGPALLKRSQQYIGRLSSRSPLPFALGLVVAITLVLTVVSVAIYYATGASNLDLSRPGFERERGEVRTNTSNKTYDTTGKVTSEALGDFFKEYDERASDLRQYGDFRDQALDDASLQLSD